MASTQSTSSGFLTHAEAEVNMFTAKKHDVISITIDFVRPSNSQGRIGKLDRGCGKNTSRGRGRLWQVRSTQPSAPPSARPPAQTALVEAPTTLTAIG